MFTQCIQTSCFDGTMENMLGVRLDNMLVRHVKWFGWMKLNETYPAGKARSRACWALAIFLCP